MWIDPETYSMCSEETQKFGDIYARYIMNSGCSVEYMNVTPMIRRFYKWFNDKYA